ncbi:MAG: R3H domain-containing nucleic acid-binding protein [Dehalococcoidia bacterium]|nr:R3H domain-containing nucleic acid-binding protein [Dehalococcoidia bacterium]
MTDLLSSASNQHIVTDDLDLLLEALPPRIREQLQSAERREGLLEIVLDIGRLPEARYPGREVVLSHTEVTDEDLQFVIDHIGEFGQDNRAGIERTLHRISCMRNRRGRIIGLTCRVGRALYGTIRVINDLVMGGNSILLLGRPGVGKTTMLREVARVLADDANRRVVIVDTSNEIGGDGDIPHPAIGGARRMQVATPALQHAVMIEAVENHMPEVIVIDEIGTELEAQAARTIAERGVQLVGTAHGNELENLMQNPTLSDLIGGIQSVTLGDDEARRRGTQKSILERKAPPTFDVVVEIQSWESVAVHPDVAATVDSMLRGWPAPPELRHLNQQGEVETLDARDVQAEREERQQEQSRERAAREEPAGPIALYPFGVSRQKLEHAARVLNVPVELVGDVRDAEAVITMRSYLRRKPQALRDAEERNLPMYVIKSNNTFQMEQVLLQFQPGPGAGAGGDGGGNGSRGVRRDPMADVFRDTEEAIARVIDEGKPMELEPANSYVRRVQHQIAGRYNLESRSSGKEPQRRVRILPFPPGSGGGKR